jgi:hypothetical protein
MDLPGPEALPPSVACIFAFAADPQDDTQVITQTKNSLGREHPSVSRLPDHLGDRADEQGQR